MLEKGHCGLYKAPKMEGYEMLRVEGDNIKSIIGHDLKESKL